LDDPSPGRAFINDLSSGIPWNADTSLAAGLFARFRRRGDKLIAIKFVIKQKCYRPAKSRQFRQSTRKLVSMPVAKGA
jgi:hypothetical protein